MPRVRTLLLSSLLILGSAGLLGLAGYTLILDQQVRSKFSGARWALPAQIYAAPLELYPGRVMQPAELVDELNRLGYRRGGSGQGSYRQRGERIELTSRPFRYADGAQPSLPLAVSFDNGRISGLAEGRAGQPQALIRLDPLLIGSIYPQHGEDRVLVRLDQVPALLREGLIETEDQRNRLRELKCHRGQGFLMARPAPWEELLPLVVDSF